MPKRVPAENPNQVIAGMLQDNDSTGTELPASFQAGLYKRRPHTFPLILRHSGYQRKTPDLKRISSHYAYRNRRSDQA